MRQATALLPLLIATLAAPAVSGDEATPHLRITELLPDPDTTAHQREFVEIANLGTAEARLEGWSVADQAGNRFVLPSWTLPAGRRMVIWGGGASDSLGPAWSSSSVWNNAGDTVILADPGGRVADWLSYGSARSSTPPDGFTAAGHPAAPPKGQSVELDGTWAAAAPTPGLAPGTLGGTVTAEVANTPPTARFDAAPATVQPGAAVTLRFTVADDNGDADVSWQLTGNGVLLASGAGGTHSKQATAPASGTWLLRLVATDTAGAAAEATATVTVQRAGLRIEMPDGGRLLFPALLPGARNVTSENAFVLRNDGGAPVQPRFDLSDFRGPGVLPVAGNAWIGTTAGNATAWTRYDGPLTLLPDLAPGASASVSLRIAEVPVPMPAGSYGTSFSVVA